MSIDVAGIGAVADFASKVLERIFPDPTERLKAQTALATLQANGELTQLAGQMEIDKVEAASTNWFVAGWRPFVGWTCGAAFAYSFVMLPFLEFFVYLWGSPETTAQMKNLPKLDLAAMLPVLFGMLGIGGLRTFEKVKGAEANR